MDGSGALGWNAAPALVDWCEANYVVSPWVAEWWNSVSSLAMLAPATWGYARVADSLLRYRLGMILLGAVGAGSATFHGTLLRSAQAADELPMVFAGVACLWTMSLRGRPAREGVRLGVALAIFLVFFCIFYFTVPWAFLLFTGCYGAMVSWVAVRTMQLTWGAPSPARVRRAAATMVLALGSAFFVFWLPEHVLLPCDHPLQRLQLHSYWHLLGAVGGVSWWIWARRDAERLEIEQPAVA